MTDDFVCDTPLPRRVDGGTGLRLAAVFSDHLVLQQGRQTQVFGWDRPGARVTARLVDGSGTAVAESAQIVGGDGDLDLLLPALPAGGPYTLVVEDGTDTLRRTDVWVGEVWVAAGQSNMEYRLRDAKGGPQSVENSTNPAIRFFQVPEIGWFDPDYAAREDQERWRLSAPDAAGDFSAVAWFFARDLQKKLGVHVGIVSCYVGGSSASSWISLRTLASTRLGQRYIDDYQSLIATLTPEKYQKDYEAWKSAFDTYNDNCGKARKENPDVTMEELTAEYGECPWPPPAGPHSKYRPAGTFESMVLRVARYTARGVMWYQGSADEDRAEDYLGLLTLLVAQWRALWRDPDQQWLVVQLPRFITKQEADLGRIPRNWADLRKAQWDLQRLPGVHTVVTLDQGEFNNLHPLDKEPIGTRLARAARQFVYGDPAAHGAPMTALGAVLAGEGHTQDGQDPQGPQDQQNSLPVPGSDPSHSGSSHSDPSHSPAKVPGTCSSRRSEEDWETGNAVIVRFPHTVELHADVMRPGDTGFELAGDDGVFSTAAARPGDDGRSVVLTGSNDAVPTRVRYGWRNWTAAPLFDAHGLPVAPFELRISK